MKNKIRNIEAIKESVDRIDKIKKLKIMPRKLLIGQDHRIRPRNLKYKE